MLLSLKQFYGNQLIALFENKIMSKCTSWEPSVNQSLPNVNKWPSKYGNYE